MKLTYKVRIDQWSGTESTNDQGQNRLGPI